MLKRRWMALFSAVICLFACTMTAFAAQEYTPPFELESGSVCLMNSETGEIIYQKNGDQPVDPGFITQLMVAIMALENIDDLSTEITYKVYLQDMLYGVSGATTGRPGGRGNGDGPMAFSMPSPCKTPVTRPSSWPITWGTAP